MKDGGTAARIGRVSRRIARNIAYLFRWQLGDQAQAVKDLQERLSEQQEALRALTSRHIPALEAKLTKQLESERARLTSIIGDLERRKVDLRNRLQQAEAELARMKEQLTISAEERKEFRSMWKKEAKRIDQLDRESLAILQTSYGAEPWLEKAKDLHKGERCFLLGCGPSLNRVDLRKLAGEHVMGVNGTYLLPNVEIEYFITVSQFFWKDHVEGLKALRCARAFLPPYVEIEPACPTTRLRVLGENEYARVGEKPWHFSKEAHRYVCLGGSVIAVGLQILYHLGFSQVIVLGLDHDYGLTPEEERQEGFEKRAADLNAHFIDSYYGPDTQVHIDVPASERAYQLAQDAFVADGRSILNASPGTKLAIFPVVEYETLFH